MSDRSLWATLRTLALAFLNATLILAALVLWLGWRTADAVHEASDDVRLALAELIPLRVGTEDRGDETAGSN